MSTRSFNFLEGEILLVDKPLKWTSFDVVKKLRWEIKQRLNVKKIKVGHAGTLDPLATGLLVICTGKMTKQINSFMTESKTYSGTITMGATTPSFDLETEVIAGENLADFDVSILDDIAKEFTGNVLQTPPIFSAKKVDGKRAYNEARKGNEVKLEPVSITIESLELDYSNFPNVTFKTTCSKGTYIRSLAHDIGQKAGVGAYLSELRRDASGSLNTDDAHSVDEWIELIRES